MVLIPFDLFQCVLSDWLEADMIVISNLDIAFGPHGRQDFLLMLPLLTNHSNLTGIQDYVQYLKWISARQIPLAALWVALEDIDYLDTGELEGETFPTIQAIHLQATEHGEVDTDLWASFLSHFPGLNWFNSWHTMEDQHVLAVHAQHYALVYLELTGCHHMTRSVLADLMVSHSLTLEVLQCWFLDDGCFPAGCQFPKLKDTMIDCSLISPTNLVRFCSLLVVVQRLQLQCLPRRQQFLTRQVADQITKACPLLTDFTFRCKDIKAPFCLRAIFANCPQLQKLTIGNFNHLYYSPEDKDWKVMLESSSEDINYDFVRQAIGAIDRLGSIGGVGRPSDQIMQPYREKYGNKVRFNQSGRFFMIGMTDVNGVR